VVFLLSASEIWQMAQRFAGLVRQGAELCAVLQSWFSSAAIVTMQTQDEKQGSKTLMCEK
jgi:hypothetical protein